MTYEMKLKYALIEMECSVKTYVVIQFYEKGQEIDTLYDIILPENGVRQIKTYNWPPSADNFKATIDSSVSSVPFRIFDWEYRETPFYSFSADI